MRGSTFACAGAMHIVERGLEGEHGGTSVDAGRMSFSKSAYSDFAASKARRSSRKAIGHNFLGGAAAACLVLGCAWTVYANIFAASVYPTLGNVNFDSPVIRPAVERRAPLPADRVVAAFSELAPSTSAPAAATPRPLLSFDDRFAAAAPQAVDPKSEAPKLAEAARPKETTPAPPRAQVAAIAPPPRPAEAEPAKSPGVAVRDMAQRAKAAVMSIAANEKQTVFEKLWGKQPSRGLLSFASADTSAITGSIGQNQNPALGGSAPYDRSTAVYDISAHTVYLPDGTKLEAHSGLGDRLDDPRSANIRMRGVTPPHVYELTPREALFHGVPALRLNPIGGEDAIFGRSGLLAHSFMLGPNGDSNGCVSFRDYNAFLNAYRNQGIKRLAVVARID